MEPIIHTLQAGDSLSVYIYARDRYSRHSLAVNAGEQYKITSAADQRWVDLFIPASPNGYGNVLANWFGQRVKGAKCFCLCAAYNYDDNGAFAIGTDHTFIASVTGTLSFFANDVPGYDWNNWGKILVTIYRIK